MKGNLTVATGFSETTTGALAPGVAERYLPPVRLLASGVPTNLGIVHDAGHEEPWSIALECPPSKAAVRDYGARWAIEPTFSDFKRRGVHLADTRLQAPERLDRLILIMTLAMYGCVSVGRHDAWYQPRPLEKKARRRSTPTTGVPKKSGAAWSPGSNAAGAY